jgi:hypothetical protein
MDDQEPGLSMRPCAVGQALMTPFATSVQNPLLGQHPLMHLWLTCCNTLPSLSGSGNLPLVIVPAAAKFRACVIIYVDESTVGHPVGRPR